MKAVTGALRATAGMCAAIAVMTAATAYGQTIASPDGAPAQNHPIELLRLNSVPGVEAGAFRIRDWQLRGTDEPLWALSSTQRPLGPPARLPRPRGTKRSGAYRDAQRVMAAVAMGVAGFFGGGIVGAAINSNCHCDSPGMQGFVVGAPIGAAVGAALGFVMVR